MYIKKNQWAVWDKKNQKFITRRGSMIFADKTLAWLIAEKERTSSPYRIVKVRIKIQK